MIVFQVIGIIVSFVIIVLGLIVSYLLIKDYMDDFKISKVVKPQDYMSERELKRIRENIDRRLARLE